MNKQTLVRSNAQLEALQVLGTEVRFLCEGQHTARAFSMIEVMLPQGSGPPLHHHDWDEAYYVADGALRFQLDGTTFDVGKGDFVYAPAGAIHGFAGLSETPSRLIVLDAPAHAAGFFREIDRETKHAGDEGADVPAIGRKHGVHFLSR